MQWDWEIALRVLAYVASVIGALGTILGLFWWLMTLYYRNKFKEIELLKAENRALDEKMNKANSANTQLIEDQKKTQKRIEKSDADLRAERKRREQKRREYNDYREIWRQRQEELRNEIEAKNTEIESKNAELIEKSKSHDHLQIIAERMKQYRRSRLWTRPVLPNAPAFLARDRRTTRIISILNLKGGVGKTTITANLGAAFAETGRVLMIDLDFQRSLSRLMLSGQERNLRHYAKRCVQHFLSGNVHDVRTFLTMVGDEIGEPDNCWFLPNSDSVRDTSPSKETSGYEDDSLEETELRLMFDWVFEPNSKDIRFHLREATHHPEPDNPFKYILMDCPPRLTTACINALAASDYVLVPVTLDAMAANSVPYLMKNLKHLKDALPHLEVLGVVANKVRLTGGDLTAPQFKAWENLRNQKRDYCLFDSKIRDHAAISMFANDSIDDEKRSLRATKRYDEVKSDFSDLAKEVENEMAKRENATLASVLA